jgi:hypothetical protein
MKKLVVLACLVLAANAFAQIDPDDDGVGLYQDQGGTIHCWQADPSVPFTAYIVLTNPTAGGVRGWECKLNYDTVFVFLLNTVYNGSAVNPCTPPEFCVGLGSSLPVGPAVWLAELTLLLLIPGSQDFYMDVTSSPTVPGELVYLDEALAPVIMRQSTGGPTIPVANVNGDCPVDADDATWGGVKALYR